MGLSVLLSLRKGSAQDSTLPVEAQAGDQLVSIALMNSHLGYTYIGEGGIRYFVTQARLTNQSDRALTVPLAGIELMVDGNSYKPNRKFPQLTGYDFRVNRMSYRFRDLKRTEVLQLSPGMSGSAWIIFTDLPKTQDVPQLELQLKLEGIEHRFDVTGFYDSALQLRPERIGPRGALGLLTIDGKLNTISVGTLVETIDQLATSGISRIVVGFGNEADLIDERLESWLLQTAEGVQTSRTYAMFPAVVSTIRQLHVANLPGKEHDVSAAHVHDSVASAVEAALASAYRGLTPPEIMAEIEQGHPLSQAAALVNAGGDLPPEYLPLLLDRANSEDRLLRRGAFIALSGSGNTEAIQTLASQVLGTDRTAAALALECLAASRYAGAHEALQQILGRPLAIDEATIVRILARYPRPYWADYLSQLARDQDGTVTSDVRREVVMALGQTGHPQLTQILGDALESSDQSLRQVAFGLLLSRQDAQSEQLALTYALKQLGQLPPTPQMLQLFDRVRDPRIAPLLMPYLDDEDVDRSDLITTLARIGPSDVDDELANRYESLKPNEQATVLANLTQLRSKRLASLTETALASEQHEVFNAAVRSLELLSDETSVDLLAASLADAKDVGRVSTLAKALEDIGLPQAARALEVAKNSSSGDKRLAIVKRLQSLRRKSPGGQYLGRAEGYVQENDHKKAIEFYSLALKLDPDLAPAYSGRGHSQLQLEDYQQAESDFRRSIELDPDDGLAVAGLGITLAISGDVEQAVKTIEQASERFPQDLLFAYNAACVYGRAAEFVAGQPNADEHQQLQRRYQQAALSRLKTSVELGFADLEWMQQDPDLASLRELAGFRKITGADDSSDEDEDAGNKQPEKQGAQPRSNAQPLPGEQ